MKFGRMMKVAVAVVALFVLGLNPAYAEINLQDWTLEYEEIEESVKNNIQIIITNKNIQDLEDYTNKKNDSDLRNSLNGLIQTIDDLYWAVDGIKSTYPDFAPMVEATQVMLSVTRDNIFQQFNSIYDKVENRSKQIELAKMNEDQARMTLAGTTKNLFFLYHQLSGNIEQLEATRVQLVEKIELLNQQLKLGIVAPTAVTELETSLMELDVSKSALNNQKNSLLLQIKGLIGLTDKNSLVIGRLPEIDRGFVESINIKKDIETALENAMSIKIKKFEQDSFDRMIDSDDTNLLEQYDIQILENKAVQTLKDKYNSLLDANGKLLLSERKLEAAKQKLEHARIKYRVGTISRRELKDLEDEVKKQELTVRSDLISLYNEIEGYKDMVAGLL